MSAFDYGRLGSLLRLCSDRLGLLADEHEEAPGELKSVAVMLRELRDAERELKAAMKIVLRERLSIRSSGGTS
jgi:hypothetical protein